jgi:predicted GNAT family acetyltransferase
VQRRQEGIVAESAVEVINNEAQSRFEAHVDGHLAQAQYERSGDRIVFTHTLVPDALEGRGVGSALARAALDGARAQHLTVVPRCPFIRSYIARHPDYLDLVDPALRAEVERSGR